MKIEKVRASVGVTVNLGNYESLRLEYSAEASISPPESAEESINILRDELKEKIKGDLVTTDGGKRFLQTK